MLRMPTEKRRELLYYMNEYFLNLVLIDCHKFRGPIQHHFYPHTLEILLLYEYSLCQIVRALADRRKIDLIPIVLFSRIIAD